MKKTLLSVIAGLAVIGSATAVPSMDVQQKNCEDGQHVWVEKTKTCVPINPCLSGDRTISEAYCIDDFNNIEDGLVWLVKLYAQNVLKTEVSGTTHLVSDDMSCHWYLAVKTSDGGYFVADGCDTFDTTKEGAIFADIIDARLALLGSGGPCLGEENKVECSTAIDGNMLTEQDCNQIAELASSLSGISISNSYKVDDKKCVFVY